MCFILATYELEHGHTTTLLNQWKQNPHGAGIASRKKGRGNELMVEKGIMDKEALKKSLDLLLGQTVVAHLRNGTHGAICPEDTHPFWTCNNEAVMFHNGVLPPPWSSCREVSDSRLMALTLSMTPFLDVMIDKPKIENQIGRWNKLVFLSRNGIILILNERSGQYFPKGSNTWISAGKIPAKWLQQEMFS